MPIVVTCQCGKTLRAKDSLRGKKVRCPECGGVLTVEERTDEPEAEASAEQAPPPLPPKNAEPPAPPPIPAAGEPPSPPPVPPTSGSPEVGLWVEKKGDKATVIAVDDQIIAEGSFRKEDWRQVREDINAGVDLAQIFDGQTCKWLETVQRVTIDIKRCYVTINYLDGKDANDSTLHPRDEADQMEIFESLERHLGPDWDRKEMEMGPARAALFPGIGIVVCIILTFVFFMAAKQAESGNFEISGRRAGLKRLAAWLLETIGPVGVLIIGVLCLAGCIAWLIAMMRNPPHLFVLKPRK